MSDGPAVLHRGVCTCEWTGLWTESHRTAADAAWMHVDHGGCDGEWDVEVQWPHLIVDGRHERRAKLHGINA